MEATIDLAATYDNPFDPQDVEVRGRLTTPGGRLAEFDGFFYQPYRRRAGADDSKTPLLDATGPPCWNIRFTPTEVGRHTLQAAVRDRSGQVETKSVEFQVVASASPASSASASSMVAISSSTTARHSFPSAKTCKTIGRC